jgi:hypothetical protein
VTSQEEDRRRLAAIGEALREGVAVPTDTYITEDIPLLLTLLSKVDRLPPVRRPRRKADNADVPQVSDDDRPNAP